MMKNLTFTFAILASTACFAQYEHNIEFNDGSTFTNSVMEIDSISFGTDGIPVMHLNLMNQSTNNYGLELIDQVTYNLIVGSITSLNCDNTTDPGTLTAWEEATEVSITIPYTGGNGGSHDGLEVESEGVTNLTATLIQGEFNNGSGTLSFSITGTPSASGTASFVINIGGQSCTLNLTVELPVGTITDLQCDSATHNGPLTAGEAAIGVSSTIPYTGGNGGSYDGLEVDSEGVTSLTAVLLQGEFNNGSGMLNFTITGTPSASGTASFVINIGGQSCTLNLIVNTPPPGYPPGTVHCISGGTAVVEVTNPSTGQIWMDRNLGAVQTATASDDSASYGDLYQWGRFSDGHQCRNSETIGSQANTWMPGQGNPWDGKFITGSSNWLSGTTNNDLWQPDTGINNPCPDGYRLPTETELNTERLSWISNSRAGAFASPLKLPAAGLRYGNSGSIFNISSAGYYWSSTVSGNSSHGLYFFISQAFIATSDRTNGLSVRCIKD